jgi:hypothetical protein
MENFVGPSGEAITDGPGRPQRGFGAPMADSRKGMRLQSLFKNYIQSADALPNSHPLRRIVREMQEAQLQLPCDEFEETVAGSAAQPAPIVRTTDITEAPTNMKHESTEHRVLGAQRDATLKRKSYKSDPALAYLDTHYPDGSWKTRVACLKLLRDLKRAGIDIGERTLTRLRTGKK